MEPEFLAQTAEPMTGVERQAWFRARAVEANERGLYWARYSVDDADDPKITLIECWRECPDDHGEPRFQLVHA